MILGHHTHIVGHISPVEMRHFCAVCLLSAVTYVISIVHSMLERGRKYIFGLVTLTTVNGGVG